MEDVLNCPICGDKFKNRHLNNKLLLPVGKLSNYVERLCSSGHNHIMNLWVDKKTNCVDLIKIGLDAKYSRFIEINFLQHKSRITCIKNGVYEFVDVPKLLELDFPYLAELKEKIDLYILFS